jgi:DNA-binding PadR family transcriptional regulator
LTRGRPAGLTKIEIDILRAGLVASVRSGRPHFWGFELQKVFKTLTGRNLSWGTLFPALRRLERMEHLTSEWSDESETGKRPRRYYRLTKSGRKEAEAAAKGK